MIEHVVTPAIDHSGLEDRVVHTSLSDKLFGSPLGLMIRRATLGSRTQEAKKEEAPDSGATRPLEHVGRALDVNALIGLSANLTVDAGAVSDCIASCKYFRETPRIGKICSKECHPGRRPNGVVPAVYTARNQHNVVAGGGKRTRQMAADEASATSNCYLHDCLLSAFFFR